MFTTHLQPITFIIIERSKLWYVMSSHQIQKDKQQHIFITKNDKYHKKKFTFPNYTTEWNSILENT